MNQSVRFRPQIGRTPVLFREYREGLSLAEMVRDVGDALPPEIWTHGIAQVGPDEYNIVRPEHWHLVRPKAWTNIDFRIVPQDDDVLDIGKAFLSVATLALGAIPGIGPLLSIAVGIGGSLLLGALAPKPKTPSSGGQGSQKQLGQGGFASNVLAPYDQVPCVKGRKRVAAPHLAPPFVTIQGEDIFGKLCIGLAGRHDVSDLLVNGSAPIATQGPIIRTGLPSDGPLTVYDQIVWQESGKRLMEYNLVQDVSTGQRIKFVHQSQTFADIPSYTTFRLGKIRPDRLVIDLLWDSGIAQSTANAACGVAFELGFKTRGGFRPEVWLPQIHYMANFRGPIRAKIVIQFAADPGGLTAPSASSPWRQAFANSSAQSFVSNSAHSYYGTGDVATHVGVADPNILTIYVDPASITVNPTDELWIRKGHGYQPGRMNYANNKYNAFGGPAIDGLWWSAVSNAGVLSCQEDQALFYCTCTIEQLSRIWDDDPLDPEGLTTIEMEVRNTQIDSITFVADGYVRYKWDRGLQQWTSEPHASENPAEIAYDILRNDDPVMNSRPLSTSLIDDAAHGAWAEWCADNDKRCDAIIESGSVEDALSLCYQAGHGKLVRSRKWAPWIEKDRSAEPPIKIYGPRDFWNWTIEKSFDRKPHALRTKFDDATQDWITTPERLVYAEGRNVDNATLFEEVEYRSIDTDYNVDDRARIDLAIMRKRSASYSFETRNRWLATPRGSLIGVSHPMLHANHVHAGIRRIIYDDPDLRNFIMGVILDGEIDMVPGTTGIALSSLEAEVFALQSVDPGPTRQIMFTAPIANDAGIDEGATLAAGPASLVYKVFYVDDIKPGPRFSAKMMLVDEAPEIHGGSRGEAETDIHTVTDIHSVTDVHAIG